MKKLFLILLVAVMAFGLLVSCEEGETAPTEMSEEKRMLAGMSIEAAMMTVSYPVDPATVVTSAGGATLDNAELDVDAFIAAVGPSEGALASLHHWLDGVKITGTISVNPENGDLISITLKVKFQEEGTHTLNYRIADGYLTLDKVKYLTPSLSS